MENNFFVYLQQLELMAFFSGYPLIYALTVLVAGHKVKVNSFRSRVVSLLPYGYALIGTLYLGLQLKNIYLTYSPENMKQMVLQPYLMFWGLLSLLFWIPAVSKKKELSLLHSLVFFFFLVRDLFNQFSGLSAAREMFRNDMRIFTISLLLNFGALLFVVLLSFLVRIRTKW